MLSLGHFQHLHIPTSLRESGALPTNGVNIAAQSNSPSHLKEAIEMDLYSWYLIY